MEIDRTPFVNASEEFQRPGLSYEQGRYNGFNPFFAGNMEAPGKAADWNWLSLYISSFQSSLTTGALPPITTFGTLTVTNLMLPAMTQGSVLFAGAGGQVSQDNTDFFWDNTNKFLKIQGTSGKQLRLGYDGTHYTDLQTDSVGDFYITPTDQYVIIQGTSASNLWINNTHATTSNSALYFTRSLTMEWAMYTFGTNHNLFFDNASGNQGLWSYSTGKLALGGLTVTPRRRLDIGDTGGPQLRLTYTDNSVYADLQTDSGGVLTLTTTGNSVKLPYLTSGSVLFAGTGGAISQNNASFFWDNANLRATFGTAYFYTPGVSNLFVGQNAGNLTLTGNSNQGIGNLIFLNVTSGSTNTAVGHAALTAITSGSGSTGVGYQALTHTTIVDYNTAFGYVSLWTNTTGLKNTACGATTLYSNTTGSYNCAFGFTALQNALTADYNSAFGYQALNAATTGHRNSAFGGVALLINTTGFYNTAIGYESLSFNTTGSYNTAVGMASLFTTATSDNGTAVGYFALELATGGDNTALGFSAGVTLTTGTKNTFLGSTADTSLVSATLSTAIGYGASVSASNMMALGGVGANAVSVIIGGTTAARRLEVIDASNPQHRLTYTAASVYADLQVNSSGGLIITPTGGAVQLNGANARFRINDTSSNPFIDWLENGTNTIRIQSSGSACFFDTIQAAGAITFRTAVQATAFKIDANQTFFTTVTQATGMTKGFINIPGAAGPPSGTPATTTGYPLYYDQTNKKLYIYDGGWKKGQVTGVDVVYA